MLRRILHYLRQCKCEHDFHVEVFDLQSPVKVKTPDLFGRLVETGEVKYYSTNEIVYMRCKKCGYYTSHLKVGVNLK